MSPGLAPSEVALIGVLAAWGVLAIVFLVVRLRSPRDRSTRNTPSRDVRAWYGFLGQAAAVAAIWSWKRPAGTDFFAGADLGWALTALALAIAAGAAWLSTSGLLALGRVWPVGARVADDHPPGSCIRKASCRTGSRSG